VYSSQTKLSGSTSTTVYVLSTGTPYVAVQLQTVPSTVNPTDKQYLSGLVGTSTTESTIVLTVGAFHVTCVLRATLCCALRSNTPEPPQLYSRRLMRRRFFQQTLSRPLLPTLSPYR
jgi:hypothetical protein